MQEILGLENINESLSTHYLIYKITNNINGKYYIGQHCTDDIYDQYMGSGKLIRKAEQKYGLSSFTKEILFDFDNFEDMNNKEIELVQLSNCFPHDQMSYNLREGGYKGQISDYTKQLLSKAQTIRFQNLTDEQRQIWTEKLSKASSGENNPMFGKSDHAKGLVAYSRYRKGKTLEEIHGIEKAQIIKQNTSENTSGENNGCYGKRWLHNPLTNDKVYVQKDDVQKYKDLGYIEGSGKPTSLGYKWINNGLIEMQVHPEKLVEYINDGWVLGKMKNTRKMIDPITGKYKYVKPQFIQQYLDLGYILYDNKHKLKKRSKA